MFIIISISYCKIWVNEKSIEEQDGLLKEAIIILDIVLEIL